MVTARYGRVLFMRMSRRLRLVYFPKILSKSFFFAYAKRGGKQVRKVKSRNVLYFTMKSEQNNMYDLATK